MSKFYGEVEGSAKTVASRRGFDSIKSHTRGWNFGIKVECHIDENCNEVYNIYETGGSNNPNNKKLIVSKTIMQ